MVKTASFIVDLPKSIAIHLSRFGDRTEKPILSVGASGVARHNTNKND